MFHVVCDSVSTLYEVCLFFQCPCYIVAGTCNRPIAKDMYPTVMHTFYSCENGAYAPRIFRRATEAAYH